MPLCSRSPPRQRPRGATGRARGGRRRDRAPRRPARSSAVVTFAQSRFGASPRGRFPGPSAFDLGEARRDHRAIVRMEALGGEIPIASRLFRTGDAVAGHEPEPRRHANRANRAAQDDGIDHVAWLRTPRAAACGHGYRSPRPRRGRLPAPSAFDGVEARLPLRSRAAESDGIEGRPAVAVCASFIPCGCTFWAEGGGL